MVKLQDTKKTVEEDIFLLKFQTKLWCAASKKISSSTYYKAYSGLDVKLNYHLPFQQEITVFELSDYTLCFVVFTFSFSLSLFPWMKSSDALHQWQHQLWLFLNLQVSKFNNVFWMAWAITLLHILLIKITVFWTICFYLKMTMLSFLLLSLHRQLNK